MTEAELQSQIVQLAKLRGFAVMHHWISIKSEPGWPDLTLIREDRTLFREIKTDIGKVTTAQQRWLDLLRLSGHDSGVWREADWKSGRIAAELAPVWQAA